MLDEMAVSGEKEKSAIETSTGICHRKLTNGAYEYVHCLNNDEGKVGMTVSYGTTLSRVPKSAAGLGYLIVAALLPLVMIPN